MFEKRSYFNSTNLEELVEKIQKDINYKVIDNNIMDGDSLFGLLQNYIDFINDGDHPVIHSALENVLLSKGKNACESILDEFKQNLHNKIKFPMSITDIYKAF